jgi:hypothetical protein
MQITDRQNVDMQITDRQIVDMQITDRQIVDMQITDRQIVDTRMRTLLIHLTEPTLCCLSPNPCGGLSGVVR